MENSFTTNISLPIAFIAGLLSFLSPCVLPLIPGYISFISGASLQELSTAEEIRKIRYKVLLNSLMFVLGFTVVFILLGASATALSKLLLKFLRPLAIGAGVVIIIFGLHTMGVIRIPFLYMEKRFQANAKPAGLFGSFIIGLAFAFGWSPCIGPQLAGILALAASEHTVLKGIMLLLAYSIGLGIPFIITAWSITLFFKFFEKIKKHMQIIEWVSGALLVVIGALMITGGLGRIAGALDFFNKFSR
jgi:cytochrome c-type biogenesis protein